MTHSTHLKRSSGRTRGFTLIELMITVAIIGILAAIAYPSYLDQVRKSRRADAQAALLQAANRQERFYTSQYMYTQTLGAGGLGMATQTENDAYNLVIDSADSNGFQMSAVARGDQTNDDCTRLTINQRGQKSANNTAATSAISEQCW